MNVATLMDDKYSATLAALNRAWYTRGANEYEELVRLAIGDKDFAFDVMSFSPELYYFLQNPKAYAKFLLLVG